MAVFFKVIVLLVLTYFVQGEEKMNVTMSPQENDVYIEANVTVTIICNLDPGNGKSVRWLHRSTDIAVISSGMSVIYDNKERDYPKFDIRPSSDGNFSTMKITNFVSSDSGKVSCKMSEVPPLLTRLHLIKPPDRTYITQQGNGLVLSQSSRLQILRVRDQDSINLTCHSTNSKPKPLLKWMWNDTMSVAENWSSPMFSTATGAVTGISNLYLPPGFSSLLLHDTVNSSRVNTTEQPEITNQTVSVNTSTSDAHIVETTKPVKVDRWIKITCAISVGDQDYFNSVLLHIGDGSAVEKIRARSCTQFFSVLTSILLAFLI